MTPLMLTSWQRRRLERQLRETLDARVYRRTLAILEIAQGQSVASVARRLRLTSRAVYLWVEAYGQGHDPDALRDRDRSGRPSRVTDQDRAWLLDLLQRSPQDFDYAATEWTVGLLHKHLRRCTGKHLSEDTLRRELHRLDYTWKRPRYALAPDLERRGKKEVHPRAHQAVAATQHGPGRRRDRPAAVPAVARVLVAARPAQAGAPVRSQRTAEVFGAINLRTGWRLFLPREHQRAVDFQVLLHEIHCCYRGWHVALLLDEDASHTAKGSVRMAEGFAIDLLWLPKRCPELNPMDTLWGQAKDVLSADWQYSTIDEHVERFLDHL